MLPTHALWFRVAPKRTSRVGILLWAGLSQHLFFPTRSSCAEEEWPIVSHAEFSSLLFVINICLSDPNTPITIFTISTWAHMIFVVRISELERLMGRELTTSQTEIHVQSHTIKQESALELTLSQDFSRPGGSAFPHCGMGSSSNSLPTSTTWVLLFADGGDDNNDGDNSWFLQFSALY